MKENMAKKAIKRNKTTKRKNKQIDQKKIEEKVLKVAIEIAKAGNGALFVIGKVKYRKLMKQKFKEFSVFDAGSEKLLKSLGTIDGAVVINNNGIVKDYGAMIRATKVMRGFGTRHSAAVSASKNDNTVILCSASEHKVKIFKNGKYVMQIDALQKNVEKHVDKMAGILESIGAGFIGTVGVATLAPTIGVALLPGVLIFGGSYYALKFLIKKFVIR